MRLVGPNLKTSTATMTIEQRWQTQGPRAESALHLVSSGPAPCCYPAAALSSHLTVEWLHLYRPKITFGPLRATTRLMWPPHENEFDAPATEQRL